MTSIASSEGCVLFDLDGTLVDPRVGIINSIQYAMKVLGLKVMRAGDLLWMIGPPLHESFSRLYPKLSKEQISILVKSYREFYTAKGIHQCEVYDQIHNLLQQVSRRKRLLLATSKPRIFALQILKDLGLIHFFSNVYGSEMDGSRSEKAGLVSHILEKEKLQPQQCVLVGDRSFDVEAAHLNGMKSIGVSWGFGSLEEIVRARPFYLADSPPSLARVLNVL